MLWIEISSWLAVGLALASLHSWIPQYRPANQRSLYVGACLGAVIGGTLTSAASIASLLIAGFSLGKLMGAVVVGEMGAITALGPRPERPRARE